MKKPLQELNKKDITPNVFAVNIAKVILNLKSSHCYFIFQMTFGELHSWEDVE